MLIGNYAILITNEWLWCKISLKSIMDEIDENQGIVIGNLGLLQ